MKYNHLTTAEINSRLTELSLILNRTHPLSEEWDEAYSEYNGLAVVLDERYRDENENSFKAYYEEYIKGRTWEEIDPNHWEFYSDWHKDMYGYRPHII